MLGSGLGALTDGITDAVRIPFADVPAFPAATVQGHAGELVLGSLEKVPVLALAGRFHMYEGHPPQLAGFPVRVAHALGARTLVVSNAAGGINRTFAPGDLMIIEDHINLMFRSPLEGALQPGDVRFPDMAEPYDAGLRERLRGVASTLGIEVREGVYAGLVGPAYETRAEVRMMERLGADAVGMSTVPEVIVARTLSMRVAGVTCITNMACGIAGAPLDHADVLAAGRGASARFQALVRGLVAVL